MNERLKLECLPSNLKIAKGILFSRYFREVATVNRKRE